MPPKITPQQIQAFKDPLKEIATVVHDARIDVDPSLNGQRVRVIILSSGEKPGADNAWPPNELHDRLVALQRQFTSPPYDGNEVVDERRESDR